MRPLRGGVRARGVRVTTQRPGYHAPCHLRAQAVGFKGRDLLRKIPGVKPAMVMECCGHVGERLILLFENALTTRYRVQEMIRAERIVV